MSNNNKGFTAIELLVVISIVVFMLATMYPFAMRSEARSRSVSCQKSHQSLYKACHDYARTTGYFPKSENGEWQDQLEKYFCDEYNSVYTEYTCPERASLGIVKTKGDYGLNVFLGTGDKGHCDKVGIGWLPVACLNLPDATYFISDTVSFTDPRFPNGSTGVGHLDPVRYTPDRRHLQLSRYNMTYVDGHFESMSYYSNVLRFPEWIGSVPAFLK